VRELEAQISTTQEQIVINVLLISSEGEVVDELVIAAGDGGTAGDGARNEPSIQRRSAISDPAA